MKKFLLTHLFLLCTLVPLWSYAARGEAHKKDTDSISAKAVPATVEALSPEFPELDQLIIGAGNIAQPMAMMHKDGLIVNDSSIARFTNQPITSNQSLITNDQLINTQLLIPNDQLPTTNNQSTNVSFHPEGLIPPSDPIDSAQYYIAKAQAVISEIREKRKFIGYLDGESLLSLPVGIHKEIGGLDYDIAIASIKLKPQYAELEVYMTFEMPQNGKVLTFRGKGIKFTKEGGIVGDATLELVADYAINLQGDKSQIILKSGTKVNFDCSGFLEMALNADIKFARSLLVPEGPAGDTLSGNVVASFQSVLKNWNDLVVEVNLPPAGARVPRVSGKKK